MGVYGKRNRSTRFRVSKNRDSCEEIFGKDKGGVVILCPQERFARTLQGVGERSKDLQGVSEKRSDDGRLGNILGGHGNLVVSLLQVKSRKNM